MTRWIGPVGAWMLLAGFGGLGFQAGCAGTRERPSVADAAAGAGAGATNLSGGGGFDGSVSSTGYAGSSTGGPARVIGGDALGDAACASATQKAQQVPLDLYIMADSSGSMDDFIATNSTTTKWQAVTAALKTFIQDPQSAGLGVGIQYFPLEQPGVPNTCESDPVCAGFGPCDFLGVCSGSPRDMSISCQSNSDCPRGTGTCERLGGCHVTGGYCAPAGGGTLCPTIAVGDTCDPLPGYCIARDRCDTASYATPAVEVAPLPGAAAALIANLGQHMPEGLTPTSGALSGAIKHAQALARANPTHKVAVLLATDGLPSECTPTDIAGVAAIATAAQAGTPPIPTYVIGVFAPSEMAGAQTNLDALAAAGGTGRAFVVGTGNQNVTQSFLTALNAVRSSGLSCQYTVPRATQDGGQIDYYSINVQFTPSTGAPVTVGNVKGRAACSATKGGWYYDVDPSTGATPSTISICDTSCAQMKADPAGRVDVLLGCKTVIIID